MVIALVFVGVCFWRTKEESNEFWDLYFYAMPIKKKELKQFHRVGLELNDKRRAQVSVWYVNRAVVCSRPNCDTSLGWLVSDTMSGWQV